MANPVSVTYNAAASPVAGGRFIVSEFWRNLAPGWTDITPSGTRPPFGILAFSGSAWDVKGGKLYINGGGHADYGGNEVWEWDYENRATDFVRHYPPDFVGTIYGVGTPEQQYTALLPFVDNTNWPGAVVINGQPVRPISRHTYASLVWMPHLNKFTVGGGSTFSGMTPVNYWANVWPNSPQDLWFYDPATGAFEYKGSELLNAAFAVHPRFTLHGVRETLYSVDTKTSNQARVRSYDIATNAWRTHTAFATPTGIIGVRWVVDTLRDRLVCVLRPSSGNAMVWAYSLDTESWSQITTTGTPPAALDNEAWAIYAEHADEMWLMTNAASGVRKLSFATGEWATEAISGPNFTQTSGNWFYDHRRKVGLLTYQKLGSGIRVWTYKD